MPPPSTTNHLPSSHPAARQRPKSPNAVLAESEAQWLFTDAELANTPSIQEGMTYAEEKELRAKGVNFINQVGILLKLPQLTLSTAAIFFQRFLMRTSFVQKPTPEQKRRFPDMVRMHQFQSAATALFLATKVEESCRKMKEIVLACCRVALKNPNIHVDEQSKDFWRWRDCILYNEDVLLEKLCFDLTIESPHRQLFEMLKWYGIEHNKKLRNAAWAFVSDAVSTQLCLLCNSRTIAVAALYNACKYSEIQLPDDAKGRPWWDAQHVKLSDVRKAVEFMATSFEESAGKGQSAPTNGQPANPAAPASDGDGERSIYVGLSTPSVNGTQDGWDATRRKEYGQDAKSESPYPRPQQSNHLAPGSSRRGSNASSIGQKRERDDAAPTTNGIATNGDSQQSKRAKVDGMASTVVPSDTTAANDNMHEEEALRVKHGNEESEAAARRAPPATSADQAAEGSEEGEVEE